ncbi:unnamed protein product [Rotaria sp. Silwood1]|nr:unnamed protein product [Rotaria sp. Silwood1]CAF4805607.1 unnamed protein product [Rotaria sp. Silwood1]
MPYTDRNINSNDILIRKVLEGVEHIYRTKEMQPISYMDLYNLVYNYCQNTNTQSQSFRSEISRRRTQTNRPYDPHDINNLVYEELYTKLKDYLKTYLEEIIKMAMKIWKLVFFQPLQSQVTLTCLQLINAERQNETIDARFIRAAVQSYVELGFCENFSVPYCIGEITSSGLKIYKDYFEVPFLQYTEEFYRREAAYLLVHNSMSEYLKKVKQRFQEEMCRVESYLHSSTLAPLIEKLEQIFILDQLEAIYTEAKTLLYDENYSENFRPKAIKFIERISATAIDAPTEYVKLVLKIHNEFFKVAQNFFNNDEHFIAVVDKICRNFINNNVLTEAADNARKPAELLARYCDILLRKGSEIEQEVDQIMIVFDYVKDKDVFEKFYHRMLFKRLLCNVRESKDCEESMILRLKNACGLTYISKLQKLFQDGNVSKTLLDQYRIYCEKKKINDIVDFTVLVRSSNSLSLSASSNFIIPIELKQTFDSFTKFYMEQHNTRKLIWLHQHSKGDLQILYTDKKYILHVSIYQMGILLLFNKLSSWTVEQMQDETQIKIDLFLQVLYSLLKSKLIKCYEINHDLLDKGFNASYIKMNYTIHINENFRSKKTRLNLNVPCKSVEQQDTENLYRTIDDDRRTIIQAAIVRIMKARQTLKYALLVQEVIQQLSSRFELRIPMIKKCIDILIEKEYIERHPNEHGMLRYLA